MTPVDVSYIFGGMIVIMLLLLGNFIRLSEIQEQNERKKK
jgi:hypothetical protein